MLRRYIVLSFLFVSLSSISQLEINYPKYVYGSVHDYNEILASIEVGDKVVFQQNCSPELPSEVYNGVVLYEKVQLDRSRFSMFFEISDTVVISKVFHIKTKQSKKLINSIGLSTSVFIPILDKKKWISTYKQGNISYAVIIDRRHTIVIITLI